MDLISRELVNFRNQLKMTILYREGREWYLSEVAKLSNGLVTEVSGHPKHSEYLVLYEHHTKNEILKALGGGQAFTAVQIIGVKSSELPFIPGFAS